MAETAPAKSTKQKTTYNLQGLRSPIQEKIVIAKPESFKGPIINEAVTIEKLKKAWEEFTEQKKNQIAEYQILQREIKFEHPVIWLTLTNPVEENLLENFKRDLIVYLRESLKNTELTITATLYQQEGKKIIYTAKEKFEHLAEKNPYLHELKDRLGLDWDY